MDQDARWLEIQRISDHIARKDEAPTELESALCGAVWRAREWAAALKSASSAELHCVDGPVAFDLPITEERIRHIVSERFPEGPESENYRKARKAVWACLHEVSKALSARSARR